MNARPHPALTRLRLRLEIAAWRAGPAACAAWALAALLTLGCAVLAVELIGTLRGVNAAVTGSAPDDDRSPPDRPARALADAAAGAPAPAAALRRLHELAEGLGVELRASEVQHLREPQFPHGAAAHTRIVLPLRATYPRLKALVWAVLREWPTASLDHLLLRRDAPEAAVLDAQLVFSLWSRAEGATAPREEPAR